MTRMFVAGGECMVISAAQWEELDAAIDVNDVIRARELWDSWRPLSWSETAPLLEPAARPT
jgi:hypothetical protein